ncbi:hypothetical protein B296_00018816 [Ensete ventricosum]|uniref:Uncharacterized protein n=1 Tax=Ensete ventricosum TaxID=4639 RepID=A0A426ZRL1_ENSVE|nr:hypothetical protein B296_00018816 [Ensete ventricosum]
MSLSNEVFDLVLEVTTLLGIMFMLPMEVTVSSFAPPLGAHLDQIGGSKEPLLSDLEENLRSSRIKGN